MWWDVVGSAVDHAAALVAIEDENCGNDPDPQRLAQKISFKDLFLASEADEEESSSLAAVLDTLQTKWPYGVKASEVAQYAAETGEGGSAFKAALELASGKGIPIVTATAVTWRLKAIVDAPVLIHGTVLALRYMPDKNEKRRDPLREVRSNVNATSIRNLLSLTP